MDVFLIPLGAQRYELYCEPADEVDGHASATEPKGALKGLWLRFQQTLTHVERSPAPASGTAPHSAPAGSGWTKRLRDRALRWLAEKVAEQRLLWHLRNQSSATAYFPSDLTEGDAATVIRQMLRRDADRHRFWLIIDSVGLILSGVLVWVPGPNVLAYYFAFRVVGHYLSMRGARQGLDRVAWQYRASEALAELRAAASLTSAAREQHVSEIADRLTEAEYRATRPDAGWAASVRRLRAALRDRLMAVPGFLS